MSYSVAHLDASNFKDHIARGITLVDFWAPWCGPCRMQGPILDKVADQVGTKAKVAKVNVDEAPSLAATYGVRSIPTLLIMKDGQVIQQFVGVRDQVQLTQALEQAGA